MRIKNRGGRPPKEASQKRSHSINIRLNLEELTTLKERAKLAGISDSEYARQAITIGKIKPRINPETMELIRRLCGMDNNLNQIARQANSAGYSGVHQENIVISNRINNLLIELRK